MQESRLFKILYYVLEKVERQHRSLRSVLRYRSEQFIGISMLLVKQEFRFMRRQEEMVVFAF